MSPASPFAPMRHRTFAAIWVASTISSLGGLIQSVGAAWTMTSLSGSPDMVALVQTSITLPIMLFSLAAGALADRYDRRRVMLVAQVAMFTVSAALAAAAFAGLLTPWLLLSFTFALGCGMALNGPAWQASVAEQVPPEDLPGAVALNSVGYNLARSVGPAVGGIIVAAAGAATAFLVNAFTYVGLVVVLARWRPPPTVRTGPPQSLLPAIAAGFRYCVATPAIARVLLRGGAFGIAGSAVWALMALVARDLLGGGPRTYGLILGAFGLGAILGALASTRLRAALASEPIVRIGMLAFAAGTAATALSTAPAFTVAALMVAGAGWVLALATFNVTVQLAAPRPIVARALAFYQMVTFGGMALGAWAWGHVAAAQGLAPALLASAATVALAAAIGLFLPLSPAAPAPQAAR